MYKKSVDQIIVDAVQTAKRAINRNGILSAVRAERPHTSAEEVNECLARLAHEKYIALEGSGYTPGPRGQRKS